MTGTTKKVLMLHGLAQNSIMFSKKMAPLGQICGDDVEFVFLDAPNIVSPVDLAETLRLSSQVPSGAAAESSDPSLVARAWFKADARRTETVGLENSLKYIRDILAKDHYHGIFGFSQGAAMAAIVSALLERPEVFPPFLIEGKPPHPPFEFCVAGSGFKAKSPLCDIIFNSDFVTPTLHILGRTDMIIVEERSIALADISTKKRVEWHSGGHFLPTKTSWRIFIRDYLKDPLGDIPSPGQQPVSGVSTPLTLSV